MNRWSLAIMLSASLGLAGCQRPAAPERTAESPSPAPTLAPAAAAEAAPATPAPGGPAPSRPATSSRSARVEPRPTPTALAPPALVPGPVTHPTPTPEPPARVVAAGTTLPIVLKEAVTTKTAQPEDRVVAELASDVVESGEVLLPEGSEVLGHVVSAVRSGRVKGRARLVVSFDEIRVGGRTYRVDATGFDVTAESSKGKDAKIAGGAAAAGAIIGGIADGGSGAVKGGILGGAAGGAAVLATRGREVELPAGSRYKIALKRSLRLN